MTTKTKKKVLLLEQTYNREYNTAQAHDPAYTVPRYVYSVREVKNSTTPRIADVLQQSDADVYCEREDWDVTIRSTR